MRWDYSKVRNGYQALRKAKNAARRGDLEEACFRNLEAARFLREGCARPSIHVWKNIFFAERKALEVFGYLCKLGRHDLFEIYKEAVGNFLRDWTEEHIKYRFKHGSVVRNALILRNLILSEFEAILAEELFRKPKSQRTLSTIADCYKHAAEALQKVESLDSRGKYAKKKYNMYWFWSCHHKFAAFEFLQDEKMKEIGTEKALEKAGEELIRAIENAEKSVSYDSSVFSETHLLYLKFWQAVVSERLSLLRFIKEGKRKDWESSHEYWQEALKIANSPEWVSEESIFPNRFYSIEDLELEEKFLEAAFYFRHQNWQDCAHRLENLCKNFPIEFYLSWRHIQGYIRLLVAEAFQAFMTCDQKRLLKICEDLVKIRKEPIGKAGDFLCFKTVALLTPEKISKDASISVGELSELWEYFPFDSYREYHLPDRELYKPNPFLSLHPTIKEWIEQTENIASDTELYELKAKFLGSIEALLGYLYDYYSQIFSSAETTNLDEIIAKHDLEILIEKFYQFDRPSWKGPRGLFQALKDLKEAIRQLSASQDIKSYRNAYNKARDVLSNLANFAPVLVTISSVTSVDKLPVIERLPEWFTVRSHDLTLTKPQIIEARAEWSVPEHRLGREKFFISVPAEISLEPGDYYLPPDWRKGIRIFYQVSEKQPLLAVRFKPVWDFWTTEAGIAYLKVQSEKAIFILGKYGETLEEKKFYLKELTEVRDYLRNKGYSAYLVKDMPEFSKLLEQKEKLCMLASKFCILIYRDPSWAISEYEYAKDTKAVLAILSPEGLLRKLREEIKRVPIDHMRIFDFRESPIKEKVIDAAVEWAEGFLRKCRA